MSNVSVIEFTFHTFHSEKSVDKLHKKSSLDLGMLLELKPMLNRG